MKTTDITVKTFFIIFVSCISNEVINVDHAEIYAEIIILYTMKSTIKRWIKRLAVTESKKLNYESNNVPIIGITLGIEGVTYVFENTDTQLSNFCSVSWGVSFLILALKFWEILSENLNSV